MPRFEFRLESLLKYRRYRRDVLQSIYVNLLGQKREMESQREALTHRRERQIDEIRDINDASRVDISAAAARRFHSARIGAELLLQARDLEQLEQQIAVCRRELTAAEQDVEAIEKLKERQRGEFEYRQNRREQRELEDAWMSAKAGELAAR